MIWLVFARDRIALTETERCGGTGGICRNRFAETFNLERLSVDRVNGVAVQMSLEYHSEVFSALFWLPQSLVHLVEVLIRELFVKAHAVDI
jgi:hypothetical protein